MSFKAQLRDDLGIFFSLSEFAEVHYIDGKQMIAIVDADDFKELSGRSAEIENAMQGIFINSVTLYVRTADYTKPSVGYRLNLDGEYYYVTDAHESAGILKINLVSHES